MGWHCMRFGALLGIGYAFWIGCELSVVVDTYVLKYGSVLCGLSEFGVCFDKYGSKLKIYGNLYYRKVRIGRLKKAIGVLVKL